jgi:hypothetical protein
MEQIINATPTETLIGAIALYGWLAALVGAAALEAGWHLIRRPRA